MKDFFIKVFMDLNTFLIRVSRGRIGSQLGTQTILLLETQGSKSGEFREIPIAYFFHEGKYLIVESNWGKDKHANWYWNLLKNPQAKLTVKGKVLPVRSHVAHGEEHTRLWDYVTKKHPPYLEYQKMISRQIPIVIFEPVK